MEKDNKKLKEIISESLVNEDVSDSINNDLEGQNQEQSLLSKVGSFFLELLKIAILAGITIGLVRYFLFKPFYVKGQSMEPNFHEKDYLIIDEISYRFREPQRGEVIVFRAPVGSDYYLKRVIGLPGERIRIEDNKVVIFNEENPSGILIQEIYLDQSTNGVYSVILEEDQYFVLGDNRIASFDSRKFGPINKESIIGRAWVRGWPFERVSIFETPNYNF